MSEQRVWVWEQFGKLFRKVRESKGVERLANFVKELEEGHIIPPCPFGSLFKFYLRGLGLSEKDAEWKELFRLAEVAWGGGRNANDEGGDEGTYGVGGRPAGAVD